MQNLIIKNHAISRGKQFQIQEKKQGPETQQKLRYFICQNWYWMTQHFVASRYREKIDSRFLEVQS